MSYKTKQTFILLLLILCLACSAFLYFYLGGYNGFDLRGHWKLNAYTLNGYNPYEIIGKGSVVSAIGEVPVGFSTVPWACTLGIAFYAGNISVQSAYIYNFILHFVSIFITALIILLYRQRNHTITRSNICIIVLSLISHFSFCYSLIHGNSGAIICSLLILISYIAKDYPIISGILLGLAMTKPQIAGIICVPLFLQKNYKSLITAASIVILGWVGTAILTDTNMFILLKQTLDSAVAAEHQYLGLLSFLKCFGMSKTWIMLINMTLGVSYTILLWIIFIRKNTNTETSMIAMLPAFIASVFWIYKNGTDYSLLSLCTIYFCILMLQYPLSIWDSIISLFCIGYLQMSRCIVYLIIQLGADTPLARDITKGADGVCLAVIGIIYFILLKKYSGKEFSYNNLKSESFAKMNQNNC